LINDVVNVCDTNILQRKKMAMHSKEVLSVLHEYIEE